MTKQELYERVKAEIARNAKTPNEYQKRVKALAEKLKI